MSEKQTLQAGALFAGIGGVCLGFKKEKIDTVWAVENDNNSIATYEKNIAEDIVVKKNGAGISVENIDVKKLDLPPVDVLHAGFPCQSFSQAGERKGFADPRGKLFYEIIRVIKEFKDKKPSVLLLENSPHIRYGDKGSWFIELSNEIKKAGYWFRPTNSAELDPYHLTSLPQQRNRLFMVAFSTKDFKNGKFEFPTTKHEEPKNLSNYIDFEGSVNDDFYYLHEENRYHSMISSHVVDKNCIYQLRKFIVRVKEKNLCPTLTANMGQGGHNVPFVHDKKGLRKLTEYECLRLQGFPKSFRFPKELIRSKRYTQVGNSVSVPVIQLLARNIKKKIEMERR